eukprot:CAMPEP_0204361238 /NCGR_PEP_ID=MMETSP0469-20131031/38675_1 /ASSEMBLY_ACC=CAM_ASM_000384 /TAXON_ID=2969 /ORGANISM="Oxyrrhis marina" /LENGTH=67 /DNA_ID=CAMNT_0051349607 /DNA_START=228 /DNA_END=427 /DNA_ORIENTATION=+
MSGHQGGLDVIHHMSFSSVLLQTKIHTVNHRGQAHELHVHFTHVCKKPSGQHQKACSPSNHLPHHLL